MKRQLPWGLAIIFFVMANQCKAQSLDSLNQRILNLELNQRYMQLNLSRSHKSFKTGTMAIIAGTVVTIAGVILASNSSIDRDGNRNSFAGLFILGSGLVTVGTIIHIDTHKWIGRAGKKLKAN